MISEEERKKLIDEWPNCKFNCPEGKPFGCGCNQCRQNKGYFEEGEMKVLFREEEIELMWACFGDKGWLGQNGCMLALNYRSGKCLKADCHPLPQKAK